jgi:hypothetical protein
MLAKSHLLMAAAFLLGTTTAVFAQEQPRRDPTQDHLYYYGPLSPTAPSPVVEHRNTHHKPLPNMPIDRTQDHLYYYGPVEQ